jgi:hypothetical protein
MKFTNDVPSAVKNTNTQDIDGAARAISVSRIDCVNSDLLTLIVLIDLGLQWSDIDWFKSITKSKNF